MVARLHRALSSACLPGGGRELGYQPVEVNASDTRNKADASTTKGIGGKRANALKELIDNGSLGGGGGPQQRVCTSQNSSAA